MIALYLKKYSNRFVNFLVMYFFSEPAGSSESTHMCLYCAVCLVRR